MLYDEADENVKEFCACGVIWRMDEGLYILFLLSWLTWAAPSGAAFLICL